MNQYARVLFTIAAVFNLAVFLTLTLGWSMTQELLQLAPSQGSNALLRTVAAVLVLTFGYAYFMAGLDPVRYRAYILLGIIGKSLVVLVAVPVLVTGGEGYLLAALALGDLAFVGLFIHFLYQSGQRRQARFI